jgi:hypothetical protein
VNLELRIRGDIEDSALTDLHARAFGNEPGPVLTLVPRWPTSCEIIRRASLHPCGNMTRSSLRTGRRRPASPWARMFTVLEPAALAATAQALTDAERAHAATLRAS